MSFARGYRLVCMPDEARADPGRVGAVLDAELGREPRGGGAWRWTRPCRASARADASALVTLARTAANEVRCLEAIGPAGAGAGAGGADRRRRPALAART